MSRRITTLSLLAGLAMALSLAGTKPAAAEVVLNDRFPISFTAFDPCTGEFVTITGEDHVVIKQSVDQDGTVHTDLHVNRHASGVGLTSGRKYEYNLSVKQSQDNPPGCGFVITGRNRARLISQGSADNLFIVTTFTVTQNAGCVISFSSTSEMECRG